MCDPKVGSWKVSNSKYGGLTIERLVRSWRPDSAVEENSAHYHTLHIFVALDYFYLELRQQKCILKNVRIRNKREVEYPK